MINLLPEPKKLEEKGGMSNHFTRIFLNDEEKEKNLEELLDLMQLRFWNYGRKGKRWICSDNLPIPGRNNGG